MEKVACHPRPGLLRLAPPHSFRLNDTGFEPFFLTSQERLPRGSGLLKWGTRDGGERHRVLGGGVVVLAKTRN